MSTCESGGHIQTVGSPFYLPGPRGPDLPILCCLPARTSLSESSVLALRLGLLAGKQEWGDPSPVAARLTQIMSSRPVTAPRTPLVLTKAKEKVQS